MHINLALIAAITVIFHGAIALPVTRLPPQKHHYQKRGYLPTWVGVALAVVVFNNRANAIIHGDKITELREQVEEMITERKFNGIGRQNAESVTASAEPVKGIESSIIGKQKEEKKMLAGWQGGEKSEELHKWWMDRSNGG